MCKIMFILYHYNGYRWWMDGNAYIVMNSVMHSMTQSGF